MSVERAGARYLSALGRFYIYGLHGLAIEVVYTALWHLIADRNYKLQGYSSIYMFFIYAFSCMVVEALYFAMKDKYTWYARGLVYMCWTYTWEFTSGFLLSQFNFVPWDYAPWFYYHFMGLITLEYAPLWFVANILGERLIIVNTLKLMYSSKVNNDRVGIASAVLKAD